MLREAQRERAGAGDPASISGRSVRPGSPAPPPWPSAGPSDSWFNSAPVAGYPGAASPGTSELALSDLLGRLPDAFIVIDRVGTLRHVNRAFLDLVQVGAESMVIGQRLSRWLSAPGADLPMLLSIMRRHGSVRLFSTVVLGELGRRRRSRSPPPMAPPGLRTISRSSARYRPTPGDARRDHQPARGPWQASWSAGESRPRRAHQGHARPRRALLHHGGLGSGRRQSHGCRRAARPQPPEPL